MVFQNSRSKSQIGIATSIARTAGYDWRETLRLAQDLDVRLVQFYLPPIEHLEVELQTLRDELPIDWQTLFHLPPCPHSKMFGYLRTLKKYFPASVLIQHEKFFNRKTEDAISEAGFLPAPENDALSGAELSSFREQLVSILKHNNAKLVPVLDISRFFHQFHHRYESEAITREALSILQLIQQYDLPLILHVIDHISFAAKRRNWRPLFNGDLPWKRILQDVILQNINLRYVIFEYETPDSTASSIKNLLTNFPETFRL